MYDWECRHVLHRVDQDIGFWLEQAQFAGGPVLELACGTGRITVALAAAGIPVVGLDNDPMMLAAARRRQQPFEPKEPKEPKESMERRQRPMFVAADMRRFAFARRFPLVFVGYNSLQLLTAPGDLMACLVAAREHLAPGGLLGVEVTDFQRGGADGPDEAPAPLPLAEAEGIRLSGTLVHDLAARTSCYRRHFTGDGWALEDDVVVRSLDVADLELALADAGLAVVRSWIEGATVRAMAAVGAGAGPK